VNRADKCPATPGVPEQVGCPAVDPCAPGEEHAPEQCPALDDDGDGFPNGEDRCPLVSGLEAYQGCPPPKAVLKAKKIELKEAVYFDVDRASIQERSFQLIDDISRILVDNPQVKVVTIEGHTDSTGSAERNLLLSQQRADAVKTFLVRKGVAPERIDAKGFGQTRPVADDRTPAGRAKNRRVEFLVKGE
jgi:outer membrane protein OmpA-like peptidoglycan-associated protein